MLKVLLLQLPVPNNPRANIPLAAGYLKAYALKVGLLDQVEFEIMPRSIADHGGDAVIGDEIVRRKPDVLGLSLYTWNSERSLHIAASAKAALPNLLVIGGGPEVQRDNTWIMQHHALDITVLGEGEQTFTAILQMLLDERQRDNSRDILRPCMLCTIEGIGHRHGDEIQITSARPTLTDLADVPSPYLLGYLPLEPGDMALIECSRWCPYRCSFCLYGRNMGSKLGKRLFPMERVVAEVEWARAHGADAVHFVEANLNLLPYFRPLVAALKETNPNRDLKLYAELRGEHLTEEAVSAMVDAGLYAAEIGLQSANPAALAAVSRRTDLLKWAKGARHLYARNVEVFLDVILGLPEDDIESVRGTLEWIETQQLGPYDIFTLQVLPGTGVREQAATWQLRYQEQPPYYVLGTDRLSYQELRALRWELKERAGFDPREIEGMPEYAEFTAQHGRWSSHNAHDSGNLPLLIDYLDVDCTDSIAWNTVGAALADAVASRITVHVLNYAPDVIRALCWPIAEANPTILWDIIIDGDTPPPAELRMLHADWPHAIGYLDRVGVYRRPEPEPGWEKTTPRFVIIATWETALDPLRYEGIATLIWRLQNEPTDAVLSTIAAYGGDGIILDPLYIEGNLARLTAWQEEHGLLIWKDEQQAALASPLDVASHGLGRM